MLAFTKRSVAATIAALATLVVPTVASADFTESPGNDLSGDHLNPTPIAVVPDGLTTVIGTIEGAGMGVSVDIDYLRITVPAGQFLTGVFVRSGTSTGGTGSFIGLFQGATATNPATTVGADMLGYYLYKPSEAGTSILDEMATFNFMGSNPSAGFTPPLGAGDYTFWVQEGAANVFNYGFDLQLSSVPEPGSAALLLAAPGLLALRRRQRR